MVDLAKREHQVLQAVVTDYIESGEPVGSRTVFKHYGLNVSSATIRNVMADLEEIGLLYQPHTSAGRVPTEKGLRLYLDSIIQCKNLEAREKQIISHALKGATTDLHELLRQTSRVLSSICRQAGVVLLPQFSATRFKLIQLIRLRPHQILVVLITKSGLIHNARVDFEEDVGQDELDRFSRYLNEVLEDLPLAEVKQRVLDEMMEQKVLFDRLYTRALEITRRAFRVGRESSDIIIEGQTNLFSNPEFADLDRMRRILEAFEDKSRIIALLDKILRASSGVQIILGSETELDELNEVSVISSPYRKGGVLMGVLGVIGPLRMDYSRIIPVVEFTAGILSELLEEPDE